MKLENNKRDEFHMTAAKVWSSFKRTNQICSLQCHSCAQESQSTDEQAAENVNMFSFEHAVDEELTLEADEGNVLLTRQHPDADFAVHAGMKSHAGNAHDGQKSSRCNL